MISVRRRTLGLRMRSWFTQRLPAKIAALVLALLLWLVVTLQAPAEQWMEVRLDLTLDSGYALVDATPPKVRALVEGRGRDLLELATARPVAHMEAARCRRRCGGDRVRRERHRVPRRRGRARARCAAARRAPQAQARPMTLVLGIETSCDETSAAVLDGAGDAVRMRSLVILSQDVHRVFGGVVPEIASRAHLTSIVPVAERALADAGVERAN